MYNNFTDRGSSMSSEVWTGRKDKMMAFIKAKKNEYIASSAGYASSSSRQISASGSASDELMEDPDDDHLAFKLSQRLSSMFLGPPPDSEEGSHSLGCNPPFKDELLTLYPSYSRQDPVSGEYEVDIRGRLFFTPPPNRKARLFATIARQFVGLSGSSDVSTNQLEKSAATIAVADNGKLIDLETVNDSSDYDKLTSMRQSDASTASSIASYPTRASWSSSSISGRSKEETTFKERLGYLMSKAAPYRKLQITIGGQIDLAESKTFTVVTFSNGRFLTRVRVPYKPESVHVEASDEVSEVSEVLDMSHEGISVISDVDDTIKHTGVTGDKRQMLRNVLVRDYGDSSIEGVTDWYRKLHSRGAQFHYVSNSPWQLFPVVSEYLTAFKFPPGSIHLKQYSGVLNGLLEPSAEKKRITLHNVVRDFPNRKFILIGDSGEGDLEAYYDLATQYPNQILAIYIRDITLPKDDHTLLDPESRRKLQQANEPADLIDLTEDLQPAKPPTLPPRPSSVSNEAQGRKKPPPVPVKPAALRPHKAQETEVKASSAPATPAAGTPPPLPPRKNPSESANVPITEPIIMPSSQNDYGQYDVLNKPRQPAPPHDHTAPLVMPSSQNDYGEYYDILDKKIESWKTRVANVRRSLPGNCRLELWRTGKDLVDNSLKLIGGGRPVDHL